MSRRTAAALLVCVVTGNAAAVLLFSGNGPTGSATNLTAGQWNPILQQIADVLTVPIPTAGIADVRDVILPAFLGLFLLIYSFLFLVRTYHRGGSKTLEANRSNTKPLSGSMGLPPRTNSLMAFRMHSDTSNNPAGMSHRGMDGQNPLEKLSANPAERWLVTTAGAVAIIAVLSTVGNESLGLSWGWIVRFLAGAGWALLIVRTFHSTMVRRTILWLLIVGLICLLLTVAHRADRHLAYFTWPIGPITSTAAMASLWAAMAFAAAAMLACHRRFGFTFFFSMVTALVALYVLQQSQRRGPAIGLIAAAALTGWILLWPSLRTPHRKIVSLGALFLALFGGTGYVANQLHSSNPEAAGSLALRFAYWKLAGGLIAKQPSLGFGPDTCVVEMTNRVAPLRAVSPHFYHGNINLYAHNEWIQTAVELGIPGALFYLALPLGILFFAWRRLCVDETGSLPDAGPRSSAEICPHDRTATLAILAGLVAILVTESVGITLRTPIMPIWYWTLLGLLGVQCRTLPIRRQATRKARRTPGVYIFAGITLSVCCFLVTYLDMAHAVALTNPLAPHDERRCARLYASKTIDARRQAALFTSALAQIQPDESHQQNALEQWKKLYTLIPGWRDTPARYADALLAIGQQENARTILKRALDRRLNPYEMMANTLYARLNQDDPAQQLDCIRRALRHGSLNRDLQQLLTSLMKNPAVQDILQQVLPEARHEARLRSRPTPTDGRVEWLRMAAFVEYQSERSAEAIADQRLAAQFYADLERAHDPYRRSHDAETDAFFRLATMLYQSDHARYNQAYQAILAAERYAVLGIKHEHVANPDPKQGFIGGVVIPTEFPRRLYPLWRLSALLHLVTGHDTLLVARVLSYLPTENRTEAGVRGALAKLYRQARQDLDALPDERRPENYQAIVDLARRFSTPEMGAQQP